MTATVDDGPPFLARIHRYAEDVLRPAALDTPAWAPRIEQLRADAYGLADEAADAGGGRYRLPDRLALKVAGGEALGALTRALVVARSGHGVTGDDTAQLHARSALFVLVQGRSADVRDAQLRHFHALATASGAHDRTAR
jgi:hypothetical protein